MMTSSLRKLALTTHITLSVGWLGAVASFLALSITGLTSDNSMLVRSSYLAMDALAWFVILPLCFATLITGVVQALGTSWGLFRHYWVAVKLTITIIATIILLVHMRPISLMADVAQQSSFVDGAYKKFQFQLVGDASLALVALLIATTLSVYKPKGLTKFGRRNIEKR